ncbi:MAG TPA: transglycosylase SLT domain-containing protein [Xanthobacteraceae bacterium]|nr:transglycosylase SLT domain-containing protein [Xanthobacteraceae bacterium]
MLVDPGTLAGSTVTGAIRQASQATGTSFSYLLATAQVESGLNPRAGASTSSARGLFQFVDQTWLGTIKQSGAALGYGRYADAISRTPSGHYVVNDPEMRSQILKLRNDPTANAVMAGAFTQANATYLTQQLGRPPSEGELYIAHFLGAGGAARLISLAASNPNAKGADLFASAAQANPSIFYDSKTGAARTLAQVRDVLTGRYDMARSRPLAPAGTAQAMNVPTSAPLAIVPDTAGITSAFAAAAPSAVPSAQQDNQIFHGLFADDGRGGPVASVVSQLWTVPNLPPAATNAAGAAAPAPTPVGANLLELFRDPVRGS